MNVDIDHRWRNFQEQKADGLPTDHQQAAIRFLQSMLQTAILNPAAVEKQVLVLASRSVQRRFADVAPESNLFTVGSSDSDETVIK